MKKTYKLTIISMVVLFSMISAVSAYKLVCLTYGEPYPAGNRKCTHDICQVCMTDNYKQAHPSHCKNIGACEILNSSNVDGKPPKITIKSPINNKVYGSSNIMLDFTSDEPCSLTYTDNINGGGRWKKVCSNCLSYSKTRRFEEGLNNITIRCMDKNGNKAEVIQTFRVDSKAPIITKSGPAKGFADGNFFVEFSEENPSMLVLYYGTGSIIRKKSVNISLNCQSNSGKKYCNVYADIKELDGKEIQYWFQLKDVANRSVESKKISLQVDSTLPVFNNQMNFFKQGEGKNNRFVYFKFNVTEKNFYEISYFDYSDSNPRWRRLCTNLKNGICEIKKSFRLGNHNVDIMISDKAGNSITKNIRFMVS